MTDDWKRAEQERATAEMQRFMRGVKATWGLALAMGAVACLMVGIMGMSATKGHFGDLFVVAGLAGLWKASKVEA